MKSKRAFTLMLSLIFIITILIFPKDSFLNTSYALENLSDNFYLLPDQNNNFYIVDSNNNSITYLYKETQEYQSKNVLNNTTFLAAKVSNKNLYTLSNNGTTSIEVKRCKTDNNNNETILASLGSPSSIYNTGNNFFNIFAIDNSENIFFINSRNQLYSININSDVYGICADKKITSISINISGTRLYALTEDKNFLSFDISQGLSASLPYKTFNSSTDDHFYFLNDNIIVSYSGKIYSINENSNSIEELIITDSSWPATTISTIDKYILCKVSDKLINCYECNNSGQYTATKMIETNNKILCLSTSKDTCISITDNNGVKTVNILTSNDLKDIPEENSSSSDSNKESSSNTEINSEISSLLYNIDFKKYIITGVPLSTTAAVFKENISYYGYNISFKNYLGKNISSGKLGTGSTVTFEKNGFEITFKIIISGDITGEGNINSRDTSALCDYLASKSELSDEYLLASDLNNDGTVNTLDLLTIYKIINS